MKVVDQNGKVLPGFRISAYFVGYGGPIPNTTSDPKGEFILSVPKQGAYMLVASRMIGSSLYSTYNRFYHPSDEYRPVVRVDEQKRVSTQTVVLPESHSTIKGKVVDEAGSPIASPSIRLCRLESPAFCSTVKTRDRSGDFLLPAVSGPLSIHVAADGYDDWFTSYDTGLKGGTTTDLSIALAREGLGARSERRLPAPEIVFPTDGEELFGFPRLTKLQWSAVPGAVSYSVEIEGCEGNRKEKGCFNSFPINLPRYPPMSGIRDTTYEFEFLGNQPGRYRVWAVDGEGRPGMQTPWIVFYYPWTLRNDAPK